MTAIVTNMAPLLLSLVMIGITHYLLVTVVDWSKIIHRQELANPIRLRLLILLLSIVIGSIVTSFINSIGMVSQALFSSFG